MWRLTLRSGSALRAATVFRAPGAFRGFSQLASEHRKPTIEEAKAMPKEFYELPNDVVVSLANRGNSGAITERMVREIMAVDEVSWDDAQPILEKVTQEARKGLTTLHMPYYTGIVTAGLAGAISIPFIFHKNTALWFNKIAVTTDIPEPADLETIFECGMWTWGWMEPTIGEVSFLLLVAQFMRAQMLNVGLRPYGAWLEENRAKRMKQKFPQYNGLILADFAAMECHQRD